MPLQQVRKKVKTKGVTKIALSLKKHELKGSYFEAYNNLRNDLHILRELNSQLPKSIEKMVSKKKKQIRKRMQNLDEKSKEELDEFIESLGKYVKVAKKTKKGLTLKGKPAELVSEFVFDAFLFPNRFNMFIRDMSLVYLVAEFESFLSQILQISFQIKPEILMTCQKSITLEELLKFKDINDLRQQIIEKEILSIINQDIEEINRYFTEKFHIEISQFVDWKGFTERFYRRNILIHNSGLPNRIYRLKTGYKGKDERLTVPENYLAESIKLFEEMAMKIYESFHDKFG